MERTRKYVYTQRAITPKIGKQELRFVCSACRLIVFVVFVRFHENMSSGFKVMEQTRKLLLDTHTHRKDKNIIPPYAGGIIMKRLCQMHRNIQKSQKSLLLQRKFIGYENYPHVLTIP